MRSLINLPQGSMQTSLLVGTYLEAAGNWQWPLPYEVCRQAAEVGEAQRAVHKALRPLHSRPDCQLPCLPLRDAALLHLGSECLKLRLDSSQSCCFLQQHSYSVSHSQTVLLYIYAYSLLLCLVQATFLLCDVLLLVH